MSSSANLAWYRCRKVDGHGVASGAANTDPSRPSSPYPEGTLITQAPLFAERGLDLRGFWPGTLNLCFAPRIVALEQPDWHVPSLRWTHLHPPETFSFWSIQLRLPDQLECVPALIYYPHPETKDRHWQPASILEVLAPWMPGLSSNGWLEVGVDPRRIRIDKPPLSPPPFSALPGSTT